MIEKGTPISYLSGVCVIMYAQTPAVISLIFFFVMSVF